MGTGIGIFIDTAGWIALIYRHDDYHQQAKHIYAGLGHVKRMTTDAVLVESCNMFGKVPLRPFAIALMEKIRKAKNLGVLEVVHVTETLIDRGCELFQRRPDKDWSMTDCISFVVMRDKGITKAFTTDHHFEQAGFEKLLGK
jgi:predicted nucleic acid-binding protein